MSFRVCQPAAERELLLDLQASLVHFAIGLGMALLVGIPLGIAMGWNRRFDAFLDPLIEILRPIPPACLDPVCDHLVRADRLLQPGLSSLSVRSFPIIINTYSGFRGVPRVFVEAAQMLGCTKNRDLIRYIAFPAALPSVAAGIRIATGVGWMCLVAAELFGVSNYGLGQKLWFFYSLHQMDSVVVYMIILGLIGLAFDMIFRYYIDRQLPEMADRGGGVTWASLRSAT